MKQGLFFIGVFLSTIAGGQTLRCVPSFNLLFAGTGNCKDYNRKELRPHVLSPDFHFGIDFNYKKKYWIHTITAQSFPMGISFKLINKFNQPPNDSLLGFSYVSHISTINCIYLGYSIHRSGNKSFSLSEGIKFKMFYEAGFGVALNRSTNYYKQEFTTTTGGWGDPYTYTQYSYTPDRIGHSAIARLCGGFECYTNKRKKSFLIVKAFYNQGLTSMTNFRLSYEYGYFNDPSKQVKADNIKIKNKGTIWGISIGYPVTIKK